MMMALFLRFEKPYRICHQIWARELLPLSVQGSPDSSEQAVRSAQKFRKQPAFSPFLRKTHMLRAFSRKEDMLLL